MNKIKKLFIITLLFMLILLANQQVFASNIANSLTKTEYSEDFKTWLELSDEEKQKVLMPRMYDIPNTKVEYKNPFFQSRMLRSSLSSKYSLKDVIANNIIVRNQQETGSCWAFAALSSLETNLALQNYKNGVNTSKVYDFSERHMEYANTRTFANGKINEMGYNREIGAGGDYYLSASYLTNGLGAVEESSMPFKNDENLIDISELNKTVTSQVYDTRNFPSYYSSDDKSEVKEHIKNYGSVYAGVHGASLFTGDCYNNDTGAIYCSSSIFYPSDHAVAIIGWDDNYSVENFNEASRPKSNGAWIIKNSWGERMEYNLAELKEEIFNTYKQQCIAQGWTDATLIPNEFIEQAGYTIEGDIAYIKIGDNGIMYVSYEDANINKTLWGIIKSADTTDYDNIYQYDVYFAANQLTWSQSEIMLCNTFNKQTTGTEYLTQVGIYAPETYTCRVYVNPNGTSKAKSDLQLVSLKAGESETFDAGYHTLEFAEPIEIKSNSFAVVVEIASASYNIDFLMESKVDGVDTFDVVEVETGKCFFAGGHDLDTAEWIDLGQISQVYPSLANGDSTIKAFTISNIVDDSLKNIKITTPPTKTLYFEGDNFDATGMVVTAYYNNDTSTVLDSSSYSISNGSNLKTSQTSVTISYEDKHVEQPITVEKNSVTNIAIKTPPTKTEYKEGQNFDKTGMVVEITRKDGTTQTIADYTIENGNNLKNGQTSVTISYEGKSVEQPITVLANPLVEIKVDKAPTKTKYVVGQNFDKTGMVVLGIYQDETSTEITDYTIENGTNLTKEQTSVTINYQGKTTTQEIIVEEKTITGITINEKPSKLTYIQNKEDLDLTDGSLKITYNDGTTENILMTSEEIVATGFSNKNLGKIIITLKYQTKTVELEVEIIAEEVEEKAENSNLDNIKCNVIGVKASYSSDDTENNYTLMEVEINGIVKNLNNDKLEYYYYLSTRQNEENITDWTKITESQNDDDKLQFTIDSRNISNYEDISNENVLYIYIKEVAIKGGNQSVDISKAISVESHVEIDLDNSEKGNANSSNNDTDISDNTIAVGKLPQTGVQAAIVVAILVTLVIGIIVYHRYRNLSKYVK